VLSPSLAAFPPAGVGLGHPLSSKQSMLWQPWLEPQMGPRHCWGGICSQCCRRLV